MSAVLKYDPAHKPKLLDQVRIAIRVRHYSPKTEVAYVRYIRDFIIYHKKRHPEAMGVAEIRDYLSHIAINKHVAAKTQNVALCALLFLYRHVLEIDLPFIDRIERAKKPVRVPVVLTRLEVSAVLARLQGTYWLIGNLLYGAGLRLNECLSLRVKDIDFEQREIIVRDGKGGRGVRSPLDF